MMNRVGHIFRLIWLGLALICAAAVVQAASLEKIEVNSRLGEPFYAEIPLNLEEGELISKVFVEIAAASDYRIFEVYRDAAVNGIRADVVSGNRGSRVKLVSTSGIKAPFFNLIVKVRYGRVAHFKKYPVFLETPKSVIQAASKTALPVIEEGASAADETSAQAVMSVEPEVSEEAKKPEFFDGWARTGRYGPIVHGDMLSTVVQRLRIDNRYTMSQVSVALFEKNRNKFDKANMNLLLKGSYLDVPTAAEVERLSPNAAYKVFKEHQTKWRQLKQQPRYAAEAEAQRTRYSKRVSVGEKADGVAAAPVAGKVEMGASADAPAAMAGAEAGSSTGEMATAADAAMLAELRKQNELLQQKLEQSEQRIAALSQKTSEAGSAASDAKIKRLEMLVARMQGELQSARAAAAESQGGVMDWVVWVLIALVVILLVTVVILLRREPAHPSAVQAAEKKDEAVSEEAPAHAEPVVSTEEPAAVDETEAVDEFEADYASDTQGPGPFEHDENLSETDTAEMVMLDSDEEDKEPAVDYMSEVDVYIRYGMDEEALQQLELALRANPNNVEAHIRKAELLQARSDREAFSQAKAAAVAVLSGAALEQFNAKLEEFEADASEPAAEVDEAPTIAVEELPPADEGEEETTTLDFDISDLAPSDEETQTIEAELESPEPEAETESEGLDWLHEASYEDEVSESSDEGAASAATAEEENFEPSDEGGISFDTGEEETSETSDEGEISFATGEDEGSESSDEGEAPVAVGEGDTSEAFDGGGISFTTGGEGEASEPSEVAPVASGEEEISEVSGDESFISEEDDVEPISLNVDESETQEIEAILDEFEDDRSKEISLEGDSIDTQHTAQELPDSEGTLELDPDSVTQELDNLLNDYASEQGDDLLVEELRDDEIPMPSSQDAVDIEDEMTATQHLDRLLGSFTDDDDFEFDSGEEGEMISFDDEEDKEPKAESGDDDPFGSTQHLDSMIDSFAEGGEGSPVLDFEENTFTSDNQEGEGEAADAQVDHNATQELDQLLSRFGDEHDDEDKPS